jgi:hypothetical protein
VSPAHLCDHQILLVFGALRKNGALERFRKSEPWVSGQYVSYNNLQHGPAYR